MEIHHLTRQPLRFSLGYQLFASKGPTRIPFVIRGWTAVCLQQKLAQGGRWKLAVPSPSYCYGEQTTWERALDLRWFPQSQTPYCVNGWGRMGGHWLPTEMQNKDEMSQLGTGRSTSRTSKDDSDPRLVKMGLFLIQMSWGVKSWCLWAHLQGALLYKSVIGTCWAWWQNLHKPEKH